jgi:hypothetical protein
VAEGGEVKRQPPDDVDWCCPGFSGGYRNAGRRGLGILVDCPDNTPRFHFQFRAINRGDESQVPSTAVPLSLCTETGLRFCPWCGEFLAERYPLEVAKALSRPDLKISLA